MHELSICQALIEQVETVARDHSAAAVTSITVKIGPLSGVVPDLLEQAFPLASAGTVAATSTLHVVPLPIKVQCQRCGAETEATINRLLCAACGAWQTRVTSGDELLLASVELTTP